MEVAAAIGLALFASPPEVATTLVWADALAVITAVDVWALRLARLPVARPTFVAGAPELG